MQQTHSPMTPPMMLAATADGVTGPNLSWPGGVIGGGGGVAGGGLGALR